VYTLLTIYALLVYDVLREDDPTTL
jgi:hypothetical protein